MEMLPRFEVETASFGFGHFFEIELRAVDIVFNFVQESFIELIFGELGEIAATLRGVVVIHKKNLLRQLTTTAEKGYPCYVRIVAGMSFLDGEPFSAGGRTP